MARAEAVKAEKARAEAAIMQAARREAAAAQGAQAAAAQVAAAAACAEAKREAEWKAAAAKEAEVAAAKQADIDLQVELAAQAKARELENAEAQAVATKKLADAAESDDIKIQPLQSVSGIHPWDGRDADSHLIAPAVPIHVGSHVEQPQPFKKRVTHTGGSNKGRLSNSNRPSTMAALAAERRVSGAALSFSPVVQTGDAIDDLIADALGEAFPAAASKRPASVAKGVFRSRFPYSRAPDGGDYSFEAPPVVMGMLPRGGARPVAALGRPSFNRPQRRL
jgi:hypothetical protein